MPGELILPTAGTDPARTDLPAPAAIKINVQGAFIVDEDSPAASPSPPLLVEDASLEYKHDTNDIRLPNHKAVVSHVAVDVR